MKMGEAAGLVASLAIQQGAQAGNTYAQNSAMRGQARYAGAMADVNANAANMTADQLLKRGDIGASRDIMQGEQDASTLRARQAGRGVDVNTGSAAQAQSDRRLIAEIMAADTKQSAFMNSLGLRAEASAIRSNDRMNKLAVRNHNRNTLLQLGADTASTGMKAKYYNDRYGGL